MIQHLDATRPATARRLTPEQADALMIRLDPEQERVPVCTCYPQDRRRPTGAFPSVVQKFERYEELSGAAGLGGAFADLGLFTGRPDNIDLTVTGGDALIKLTDRVGREESALRVIAGQTRRTHLSRERVLATNVSDAAPATVRATGKWAEPANGDTE